MSRDWHDWHRQYDEPSSSLSRRLSTVRSCLRSLLASTEAPVRLLSLCAGDGRDTLPVIDETGVTVSGVLVELDPVLADRARSTAPPGIEVRTADAGTTASYYGGVPADVLMACGVFGNVSDDDVARTVAALPTLLTAGGHVIWTRGRRVPQDPSSHDGDPADMVRDLFEAAGFEEVSFIADESGFRVGMHRWCGPDGAAAPDQRLFTFV